MIDFKDLTFVIPIRIDSEDRLENLNAVLRFIKEHIDTRIVVLEADKDEQVKNPLIDTKIFIKDHNPIFHRTKYLNKMTLLTRSSYIAVWDSDVILELGQLERTMQVLRNKQADMVVPYNGVMYYVPEVIKRLYIKSNNIDMLTKVSDRLFPLLGHFSVGGGFIVNKIEYVNAGMENENFYGWGPEDAERIKRWEILGLRIKYMDGPLYHLYHPRNENSRHFNKDIERELLLEYFKVCKMTTKELKEYVRSFAWGNNIN